MLATYNFTFCDIGVSFLKKKERKLLALVLFGFIVLPCIYVFSTWFSFFDYSLPKWFGFVSAVLYCSGIWLFCKGYLELGPLWLPALEFKEDHKLITSGTYQWVRHPIYTSYAIIAAAQIFMLQNWIVGPAFLIMYIPFYLYRVRREELLLVSHFGDEYREYMERTNALFPKQEQLETIPLVIRIKSFIKKKK